MSGEIDKTGVPTNTGDSSNGYSVEITDYVYHKLSNINNNGDFTNAEITEYGLSVSNDKIDISTTGKLINYLKSFAKVCAKQISNKLDTSTHESYVESMELEMARLENAINAVESSVLNKMYPVGSIYMTFNSSNPHDLFGGSWVKLEDRFLVGSGSKIVGATGGEETHTLTSNEMPSHTHTQNSHNHSQADYQGNKMAYLTISTESSTITTASTGRKISSITSGDSFIVYTNGNDGIPFLIRRPNTSSATATNNNTGGGQSHNNMPPYQVVHMWRRLS